MRQESSHFPEEQTESQKVNVTFPKSDSPLEGVNRTQVLSDLRAHCPSSEAAASRDGLPDPRSLARLVVAPQGPPGQDMCDRWCSQGRGHGHQPTRSANCRRSAETKSSEEVSATLCSQGPVEGKGESIQASAWACCPHSHHLEKDKCDLDEEWGRW